MEKAANNAGQMLEASAYFGTKTLLDIFCSFAEITYFCSVTKSTNINGAKTIISKLFTGGESHQTCHLGKPIPRREVGQQRNVGIVLLGGQLRVSA